MRTDDDAGLAAATNSRAGLASRRTSKKTCDSVRVGKMNGRMARVGARPLTRSASGRKPNGMPRTLSQVVSLYVCPDKAQPMKKRVRITLVVDKGVLGDRYY